MKTTFFTLLLIILRTFYAFSQENAHSVVKGLLRDSVSQQPLPDASVVLLHARDSSVAHSTITDREGVFRLARLLEGRYLLIITFLGYQQIIRSVAVTTSQQQIDLGEIEIRRTGMMLEAVEIVEQRSPMTVRKDTLEFDAGYFKNGENALMEDLLRKLPGVQVGRDGVIKMNGVPIKNILVNGKPLFGDDLTLITRNLSAAIIDKVQLFDDRPEGIELGRRRFEPQAKVINITIKETAKRRFTGRAMAGYGTGGRFSVNGSLNRFADSEHFSVIGSGNNDNGYQDGNGRSMDGRSEGIIHPWKGAAHYSRFFNNKLKVGSSYVTNSRQINNERISFRRNLLADTINFYNQQASTVVNSISHDLNIHMGYEPDTSQKITTSVKFRRANGRNLAENMFSTLEGEVDSVNRGLTTNAEMDQALAFSSSVFYEKRFNTEDHVFRADLTVDIGKSDLKRFLWSENLFVLSNREVAVDTINQHNITGEARRRIHGRLVYLAPLSRGYSIGLVYLFTHSHTKTGRFTYDYNVIQDAYDQENDSLSNRFENASNVSWLYIQIRAQKSKHNFDIGLNLQLNGMDNYNVSRGSKLQQQRINIIPQMSWACKLAEENYVGISYRGEVKLPSVVELQPVIDNSNPIYIQQGNPALKPAYIHNINSLYNLLNTATMRSMTARLDVTLVNNKVINARWFDTLGRQISRPLNADGSYSIDVGIVNVFPLTKWRTFVNTNTSLLLSRDIGYVNNISNHVKILQLNQELNLSYTYKSLMEFSATASASYKLVRYSLRGSNNSRFMDYSLSLECNVNLPLGISAGGSLYYVTGTGRMAGYNPNITMLNLQVSKGLLRKRGLFKMQCFDLLNQNRTLSMQVGENYIEQVQSKVLNRFFTLSFSWFIK